MAIMREINRDGVRGFLHLPSTAEIRGVLGLTHGAGSNAAAPLLVALAEEFVARRFAVLRYDLPYRQKRPSGPPAGNQALDRDGIRQAAAFLQAEMPDVPLYLGGHSYGGRQTSMAASEDPRLSRALLLLSYPLHPPKQPDKARVEHFPALRTPCLFIHGVRDEFATEAEIEAARLKIPAHTEVQHLKGQGHGLSPKFASQIADWFVTFTKE